MDSLVDILINTFAFMLFFIAAMFIFIPFGLGIYLLICGWKIHWLLSLLGLFIVCLFFSIVLSNN